MSYPHFVVQSDLEFKGIFIIRCHAILPASAVDKRDFEHSGPPNLDVLPGDAQRINLYIYDRIYKWLRRNVVEFLRNVICQVFAQIFVEIFDLNFWFPRWVDNDKPEVKPPFLSR